MGGFDRPELGEKEEGRVDDVNTKFVDQIVNIENDTSENIITEGETMDATSRANWLVSPHVASAMRCRRC